jgi:riboflavin transporter
VVAVIASVAMAAIANLIVTPAYTGVSIDAVLAMIVPIIIPFNLLKFSINSIIAGLLYVSLNKVLS